MARSCRSPVGRYTPSTGSSRPSWRSARTVSTAYSGMPSARARIADTAAAGRPGTNPASRSRIAASGSGSSETDVKFLVPAPQFGRLSRSSGRARVTTRIGEFFDHSSRWSMKSSRPLSAQWRSSNRRTVVPRSAMRSKKIRHAANNTSRPPAGACSTPSSVSSAGSTQRRSCSSFTKSATVAAIRCRVVASSSFSASPTRRRTISPSAQKAIPSPYAGERPRFQ